MSETGVPTARALSAVEFAAFNDQLAQIMAAGLPLEHGLKLVGADLRRGRLAGVVKSIAEALDAGRPLDDALAEHRGAFPPAYVSLVRAGNKSGRLSEILLGLGTHLGLIQNLRATLWRAMAYPLAVFAMMLALLVFLDRSVVPAMRAIGGGHDPTLTDYRWFVRGDRYPPSANILFIPPLTAAVFAVADAAPIIVIVCGGLAVAFWLACRSATVRANFIDHVALHIPLIGPAIRDSQLAVWCDRLRLGIDANLDLPTALELAAAGSTPLLERETQELAEALRRAEPAQSLRPSGRWLGRSILQAIDESTRQGRAAAAAAALGMYYQRRAETRARAIPSIFTPLFLLFLAIAVGLIVLALLGPIAEVLQSLTS